MNRLPITGHLIFDLDFLKFRQKNKWSSRKLFQICEQLEERLKILNPNLFLYGKEISYFHDIKSWYIIETSF